MKTRSEREPTSRTPTRRVARQATLEEVAAAQHRRSRSASSGSLRSSPYGFSRLWCSTAARCCASVEKSIHPLYYVSSVLEQERKPMARASAYFLVKDCFRESR
jgi:hypothetical protein